jgi:iron complex outermembrane receptor protein
MHKQQLFVRSAILLCLAFSPKIAFAQAAGVGSPRPASGAVAQDAGNALAEIVVTARRQAERLQDVPQTVNAVPREMLQDLQIHNLSDLDKVLPGMSFADGVGQMRGVSNSININGDPTIAFYLNDADFTPTLVLGGLFDISQVEVLRGPQGTNRGVSAPSGSITIRTHRPDMSEFGGYVEGSLTDQAGRNIEGAVSVPIVKDIFSVRLAALHLQNNNGDIRSLHSDVDPESKSNAGRISLRFTPVESLEANVMYQHYENRTVSFTQVYGGGDGTAINPPIRPGERLAVSDGAVRNKLFVEALTGNLDYSFFGQKFSYVGGYGHGKTRGQQPDDNGNVLPGIEIYNQYNAPQEDKFTSHEFRLASDPSRSHLVDYTAGVYFKWFQRDGLSILAPSALPGAFGGNLAVPDLSAFNPRYLLDIDLTNQTRYRELSFFGNLTFHPTPDAELTVGLRKLDANFKAHADFATTPAYAAFPAFLVGGNCALVGGSVSAYPGLCDIPVPSIQAGKVDDRTHDSKLLYSVAGSYRFTPDFMTYFNIGTSYLRPTAGIGIQGALATSTNPDLRKLSFHPAQTSTGYEIGLKWTLPERRGYLNLALFKQNFDNFQTYAQADYFSTTTNSVITNMNFYPSVQAKVRGIDADLNVNVTSQWNVQLLASYSTGTATGKVPCNIYNSAGQPVFNTDGLISLCNGTGQVSNLPEWNATFLTSYDRPLWDDLDGFVRAQVTYNPKNDRAGANFDIEAYAFANIYLGVHDPNRGWEASMYVKNLFNDGTPLSRSEELLSENAVSSFPTLNHLSGYYSTTVLQPREIGFVFHYTWGSH